MPSIVNGYWVTTEQQNRIFRNSVTQLFLLVRPTTDKSSSIASLSNKRGEKKRQKFGKAKRTVKKEVTYHSVSDYSHTKVLSSENSQQCLKHSYFSKCCLTQFKDYWGILTGL